MGQQIGDTEHRIARLLANGHIQSGAVLAHHCSVQGQRQSGPLILLDAAIVVGLEEGQAAVLIQRVGLEVQTRGIDVADDHPNTLLQILGADGGQDQCLAAHIAVDPLAGLIATIRIKGGVAGFFQHLHRGAYRFTLDFCMVEEGFILLTECVCPGKLSGLQLFSGILGAVEKLLREQFAR